MGVVISIANQKGGVGKTTTAVNLSASLAAADKACLLIDCDPQGNTTTGLGIDKSNLEYGLYDFILGSTSDKNVIIDTPFSGLSIIGANPSLIGAEVELATSEQREYRMRNGLLPLTSKYDFILLDCPPSLGFLTLNALAASDAVLVPLQCEYYALEGLTQLLDTLKAVKKGLNRALKLAGIVLTMYDSRNNLSQQVEAEVRNHFRGTVFETIIPRNVRLSEAPSYGLPIIHYDIKSKGAQSYLSLARELIERGADNHE